MSLVLVPNTNIQHVHCIVVAKLLTYPPLICISVGREIPDTVEAPLTDTLVNGQFYFNMAIFTKPVYPHSHTNSVFFTFS